MRYDEVVHTVRSSMARKRRTYFRTSRFCRVRPLRSTSLRTLYSRIRLSTTNNAQDLTVLRMQGSSALCDRGGTPQSPFSRKNMRECMRKGSEPSSRFPCVFVTVPLQVSGAHYGPGTALQNAIDMFENVIRKRRYTFYLKRALIIALDECTRSSGLESGARLYNLENYF